MRDQQNLRSACAYAQSDLSLCWSLEYSMSVKLLTEHNFEFQSLKGGCRGSSESTLVKMPHCWKSHAAAHYVTCMSSIYKQVVNGGHGEPDDLFVCFCCFTSHVNSYGHCGTVSSLNHTFSWAGLSKRLTSNLCTYFRL